MEENENVIVLGAPEIKVPNIKIAIDGGMKITVLFRDKDSLLTFETPVPFTKEAVANAVNESLSGLDWNVDFGIAFDRQEYRKAVVSIISKLI